MPTSIAQFWDDAIVPSLVEYIKIPGQIAALRQGVGFERPYRRGGRARCQLVPQARRAGMKLEVVRLPGRTPGAVPGNTFELEL
jgi:hypothetical protein